MRDTEKLILILARFVGSQKRFARSQKRFAHIQTRFVVSQTKWSIIGKFLQTRSLQNWDKDFATVYISSFRVLGSAWYIVYNDMDGVELCTSRHESIWKETGIHMDSIWNPYGWCWAMYQQLVKPWESPPHRPRPRGTPCLPRRTTNLLPGCTSQPAPKLKECQQGINIFPLTVERFFIPS